MNLYRFKAKDRHAIRLTLGNGEVSLYWSRVFGVQVGTWFIGCIRGVTVVEPSEIIEQSNDEQNRT